MAKISKRAGAGRAGSTDRDRDIGARIRARRLSLGITQQQLAEAIGLTFQQVQKYEKGTNRISSSRLQHLAEVLKISPLFFFNGRANGKDDGDDDLLSMIDRPDTARAIRAFQRINGKRRLLAIQMLEELGRK